MVLIIVAMGIIAAVFVSGMSCKLSAINRVAQPPS
jgi:hypothetical protein